MVKSVDYLWDSECSMRNCLFLTIMIKETFSLLPYWLISPQINAWNSCVSHTDALLFGLRRSEHIKRFPNCGFLTMKKDYTEMTVAELYNMEKERLKIFYVRKLKLRWTRITCLFTPAGLPLLPFHALVIFFFSSVEAGLSQEDGIFAGGGRPHCRKSQIHARLLSITVISPHTSRGFVFVNQRPF